MKRNLDFYFNHSSEHLNAASYEILLFAYQYQTSFINRVEMSNNELSKFIASETDY